MVFSSKDHRDSPVTPQHGGRCPCCTDRAGSFVSDCHLYGVRCSPVVYQITGFPGRFQEIFMYSALSGSTVDTCRCQSSRLLVEFHTFYT